MPQITKPIILDETGQAIVQAIQQLVADPTKYVQVVDFNAMFSNSGIYIEEEE